VAAGMRDAMAEAVTGELVGRMAAMKARMPEAVGELAAVELAVFEAACKTAAVEEIAAIWPIRTSGEAEPKVAGRVRIIRIRVSPRRIAIPVARRRVPVAVSR